MKRILAGKFFAVALSAAGWLIAMPAGAVTYNPLIVEGITYTFTDNGGGSYTLSISGINAASDTRGGRYGVQALAFNEPVGYSSATLTGFTTFTGGLNANGCSGAGNFFCFDNNVLPTAPPLPANTSLFYTFTVVASGLANWQPDFKIAWVGTENNYDNVSQLFTFSSSSSSSSSSSTGGDVPAPASTLVLVGLGLMGIGFMRRRAHSA